MAISTLLQQVIHIVQQAGDAIEHLAHTGFETQYKANQDPVTEADLLANAILQQHLTALVPEAAWLSEETQDNADRLAQSLVWVIDPVDGTKEYVKRIPEYAVSVALVREGQPVLAVLYNPHSQEMYAAEQGHGAYLNGQPIYVREPQQPWVALASRSEIRRGEWQAFENDFQVHTVGSVAYKLARVAAGYADLTFSLTPKNEWDIAAGVLLVQEAGGRVTEPDGTPFVFNRSTTLVKGILATPDKIYNLVQELIKRKTLAEEV